MTQQVQSRSGEMRWTRIVAVSVILITCVGLALVWLRPHQHPMSPEIVEPLPAVASLSAPEAADVPPFVAELIARYKSVPPSSSPGAVWQYRYKGQLVYYVPRLACCDIMSQLYTNSGELICQPDGGIAGSGDGKCPSFFARREDGRQLWSDPRVRNVQ